SAHSIARRSCRIDQPAREGAEEEEMSYCRQPDSPKRRIAWRPDCSKDGLGSAEARSASTTETGLDLLHLIHVGGARRPPTCSKPRISGHSALRDTAVRCPTDRASTP